MKKYIVGLDGASWLAPWSGDPGRTLYKSEARKYSRHQDAKGALTRARKYRPFVNAWIEPCR